MADLTGYILLSFLSCGFAAAVVSSSLWPEKPWYSKTDVARFRLSSSWLSWCHNFSWSSWFSRPLMNKGHSSHRRQLQEIKDLSESLETASLLTELIQKDGAGDWPPRCQHDHTTWPAALRPYKEIYFEMAPLLSTAKASLDDCTNAERIIAFRSRFRDLLRARVDLGQVIKLLEAAEAGRWDVFPRDTYNAFYCCIAWSRHAYR